MTACSSEKQLLALLDEQLDDLTADRLVDHLGQCAVCRHKLLELSVEMEDWDSWESMLRTPQLVDLEARQTDVTRELTDTPRYEDTIALPTSAIGRAIELSRPEEWSHQREFGDYELLEKIGAGGMGIVYRARQKSANRIVALKLIRPEQLDSLPVARRKMWLERFRAEAQTAARLDHDDVATIYDVGEFRGTLYYSMQYIEGPSLAQIIRKGPIENRRAADLIRNVAMAVDHAHQKGILHRDLKPQNIMVRSSSPARANDDTTVDAAKESNQLHAHDVERPFVVDFGLAKWLEEGTDGTTHTGDVMGSPSYMSPEQAIDSSRCTTASDVYSLGSTLYDALTGRPPFRAATALQTMRQVIDDDPVAPRELNPAVARDLQTITLKALAKDPSRRYATAAMMAEDLSRYLQHKPIDARPVSLVDRAMRWCRRNPAIALLSSSVTLMLIMVAIQSQQHAVRESHARAKAESYFVTALNVIHDMLADYGDESLAHVPQMEQARKELLRKALALYQELLKSEPTNPELQIEFARTQHQVGLVHDLLGEHDEATSAYKEAIQLFEDLQRQFPTNRMLKQQWAASHTMLGESLRQRFPSDAMAYFNRAFAMQSRLNRIDPANHIYRRELSRTLNNLGLLLSESGRYELAEQRLREAIEHLRVVGDDQALEATERAEVLADLGRSQINLGVLYRQWKTGPATADVQYRNAIRNLQAAVGLDAEDGDYRFRLAVAQLDLANFFIMETADGAKRGLAMTSAASTELDALSDDFPSIPKYRYELANSLNSSAVALAMTGKTADAKTQFEQANSELQRLNAEFPDDVANEPKLQSLKGRIFGGLGFIHSQAEEWPTSRQLVEQAIRHQRIATELRPENPEFKKFLGQHYAFMATVLSHLNLQEQAEDARNRAKQLEARPEQ